MHLKFSAERRDAVEVKRERDRNMIFHQTLSLGFYEIILQFLNPTSVHFLRFASSDYHSHSSATGGS